MIAIAIARCQATSRIDFQILFAGSDLMRVAIAACILFAWLQVDSKAAFTDFSDYTQTTEFALGEVFSSNGLSFSATQLRANPNPVFISGALFPGPGVEFLLPPGIQEISLYYVDGAGSAIAINGVQPTYPGQGGIPFHAGFSFLNGATLGGVDVTTTLTTNTRTYEVGWLTLRGPINSLIIAGLELSLDDVTVRVPEPASAVMLIIGSAVLLRARRRFQIYTRTSRRL